MTGVTDIRATDKLINPFSWNTILVREGVSYSVNHHPSGRVVSGEHKAERAEIRYTVETLKEFEQLGIDAQREGLVVLR